MQCFISSIVVIVHLRGMRTKRTRRTGMLSVIFFLRKYWLPCITRTVHTHTRIFQQPTPISIQLIFQILYICAHTQSCPNIHTFKGVAQERDGKNDPAIKSKWSMSSSGKWKIQVWFFSDDGMNSHSLDWKYLKKFLVFLIISLSVRFDAQELNKKNKQKHMKLLTNLAFCISVLVLSAHLEKNDERKENWKG